MVVICDQAPGGRRSRPTPGSGRRNVDATKTPVAAKDFVVGIARPQGQVEIPRGLCGPALGVRVARTVLSEHSPLVRGPINYKGHEAIARDIAYFKAGLEAAGIGRGPG